MSKDKIFSAVKDGFGMSFSTKNLVLIRQASVVSYLAGISMISLSTKNSLCLMLAMVPLSLGLSDKAHTYRLQGSNC